MIKEKLSKKVETGVILEIQSHKVSLPLVSELSVNNAASKIYHSIIEGQQDPIKVAAMFKFMDETYSSLKTMTDETGKNSFVNLVREKIELEADDKKSLLTENGIKFSLAEVGTKYDFTGCNDAEWNKLTEQIKELDTKKKDREKFLKGIKGVLTIAVPDEETGEMIPTELYEPIKTSTSSFKSEFNKEKK